MPVPAPDALTPQLLLAAYSQGYFPMGEEDGSIAWHHPDPRAIFPMDSIVPNARFARMLRASGMRCTLDEAFPLVMERCATVHGSPWITPEMVVAYTSLHRMGHAHSVETWLNDELVGGIYGVCIGGAFFGESMFSLRANASKAGFHHLVMHLRRNDFLLFDTQYINAHTASLGAVEIPRAVFLERLSQAIALSISFA